MILGITGVVILGNSRVEDKPYSAREAIWVENIMGNSDVIMRDNLRNLIYLYLSAFIYI